MFTVDAAIVFPQLATQMKGDICVAMFCINKPPFQHVYFFLLSFVPLFVLPYTAHFLKKIWEEVVKVKRKTW